MVITINYVGFHPTLILDGLRHIMKTKGIERIYILYDRKDDSYGRVSRRNANKLKEMLAFFEPRLVPVNPLSQENIFSTIYAIVRNEIQENKCEVLIDVTDMPPIAVASTTMVALMFPRAYLYYVPAESRGDFIPPPDTPAFEDWVEEKDNVRGREPKGIELPGHMARLDLFRGEDREVSVMILKVLYDRGGKAKSLSQLIIWCNEDPKLPAVKNKFSRVVSSLEKRGLIVKYRGGRERMVELTNLGRMVIRAMLQSREIRMEMFRPITSTPFPSLK
ncbi:MAG: hypothetical protein DRN53_08125 [Thermoprotei archaeon]|nr:MAG: hypothetical protein DRN53_08125 [Thermoprotei archaeon]